MPAPRALIRRGALCPRGEPAGLLRASARRARRRGAAALRCLAPVAGFLLALSLSAAPRPDEASFEGARPPASAAKEPSELAWLREQEARLSLGRPLSPTARADIVALALGSAAPEVRALAVGVLPWLPLDDALTALVRTANDASARVRAQALDGLLSILPRVPAGDRDLVERQALVSLGDERADCACTAARLLHALATPPALDALRQAAVKAPALRYECMRELVGLPPRADVPRATGFRSDEAAAAPPVGDARDTAGPPRQAGTALVVASAAALGLGFGGLAPGMLSPYRERMTYTQTRTRYSRMEVTFWSTAGAALAGASVLGAGALLGLRVAPDASLHGAVHNALGLVGGGIAGLGAGVAWGLEGPAMGATVLAGATLGWGATLWSIGEGGAPDDALLPLGAFAAQAALAAWLSALAVEPGALAPAFARIPRLDFAVGASMLVGGASLPLLAVFHRLVPLPTRGVWAASAAGFTGAAVGFFAGSLAFPADAGGTPAPSAAAIALSAQAVAAVLTGFFAASTTPAPTEPAPLALWEWRAGRLRPGTPSLWVLAAPGALAAQPRSSATIGVGAHWLGARF